MYSEGWYFLMPSRSVKKGKLVGTELFGIEIVIFRTESGFIRALDAFCPHMGAHLKEGRVEKESIRCFFHRWCFDSTGSCVDIPSKTSGLANQIKTNPWTVVDHLGLIWIWLGNNSPTDLPLPMDLVGVSVKHKMTSSFEKKCHPHVVLVNAIDEQHFKSVHWISIPLKMESHRRSENIISFRNVHGIQTKSILGKILFRIYKGQPIHYQLTYWPGNAGTVTLGPGFFRLYLLFALRLSADGGTIGHMIALTPAKSSLFAKIFNQLVLFITLFAGKYFALGDTKIFESIRFNLAHPLQDDRAIVDFIRFVEDQPFHMCRNVNEI